jgi:hypothetical protein
VWFKWVGRGGWERGEPYQAAFLGGLDPESETNPHENPRDDLETGVCPPFTQQRHEQGAEWVENHKDNGHDKAMGRQDRGAGSAGRHHGNTAVVIVTIIVPG